ncbi:MAG TPA: PilT/PilU family type 4a pilus ATPase [Candidatus Saccharimonadales bacterium]|nr:PilT/PilU family type 4a pilus ATPase [Candidatus Saccharimonadales bacterium]
MSPTQLLEKTVSLNASDLHLSVGAYPIVRINTVLQPLEDPSPLTVDDIETFLSQVLEKEQKDLFDVNKELDFSISLGNKARFRINAFYQKGYPSVALRAIPMVIPSLSQLNLPEIVFNISNLESGLILVVGPTGHGKSTTISAIIDKINETRGEHVVTIEDPIEYIFTNKKSLVEQRELYVDTHSWEEALKSVLRQDPNVVLIGEMRDIATMTAALQISETGHLVFATLHTNSAAQTVERIIASFPENQQNEVRLQLAQTVEVILSQRLIPSAAKGVIPAVEIMLASDGIRNLIREGKTHLIDNIISTSAHLGMISMERSLADLVRSNLIDINEAVKYSSRPDELRRLVKDRKA